VATPHVTDRRYAALQCPDCGTAPEPELASCTGCGRRLRSPRGGIDLLPDEAREEADRFGAGYASLRSVEGWVAAGGREDPAGGDQALWAGRVKSMQLAARLLKDRLGPGPTPMIIDIGSGGAWASRFLPKAEVIAIDLLDVEPAGALTVRGDMRRLPVRPGAADGALFAASLHYAPVASVIAEAARVLRPGGTLVAIDSPIYARTGDAARAAERSRHYYTVSGYPELADYYFPVDSAQLRLAMTSAGFDLDRLDVRSWWRRLIRPGPASLVLATRLR